MAVRLKLPGAGPGWHLPGWSDAELRFAFNAAREENKELHIEYEAEDGTVYLTIWPSQLAWWEIIAE